ncbi:MULTISPECIES: hypothetical protein [Streptomyces albovinaceus subgroup]|uniref:Uncharacterized protein n=2 Tax=Streptomyces globisporus TaxID=1908 RepID=A0ABM9H699_STRGL|nr:MULTISPECIES: hypothetical protein [Streptomyces albovinaceus subgroup]AWL89742.1 hypothetical protein DIJ69_30925 [Streptomyces globisporus]WSF80540.1 hypothetical protein OG838_32540 [Streptomyces globisporus]CAH9419164.1 hypothetical protein SGL43_06219 [Streptomyces globisporus]
MVSKTFKTYRTAVGDTWKGWWLAWPPSERVQLGQVFHDVGGHVRPAGTLTHLGVPFTERPGTPRNDFLHDSHGSASVRFKTAGVVMDGATGLAAADLGAMVSFSKKKSALVVFKGLRETGVEDQRALAAALVQLTWDQWDDSLIAVAQVVSADSGTVLVSATGEGSAELRLQAGLGQAALGLADLAGGASILAARKLGQQWTGPACTPFFRVIRLRKRWFRDVEADYGPRQPGRGAGPVPVPPLLLEEARDEPESVLEPVSPEHQSVPDSEDR